ncbi:MAG: ROK family protein [Rhodoglobus sp.]
MGSKLSGAVDQETMRLSNLSVVLRAIAEQGRVSRSALSDSTGLTKPAVSGLVTTLEALGLVEEIGPASSTSSGRPPSLLEVDGRKYASIVVELNASFTSLIARDLSLTVLLRESHPTENLDSPEDVLGEVQLWVDRVIRVLASRGREVIGVVLAVPALVEHATRTVVAAPALGWARVETGGIAQDHWGKFSLENLANLAALGESRLPSYRPWRHLVHLEIGSGIGAGTVIDGTVQRGSTGFAGAIGHMPLDPTGRLCACGRRGCLEALGGVSALFERTVPDLLPSSPGASGPDAALLQEIIARAGAGDVTALEGIRDTGRWIGRGAAVLINMLNPDVLTLGGYVTTLEPWILPWILEQIDSLVVAPDRAGCAVQVPRRGADAPEYGAAILVRDDFFSPRSLASLAR